MYKKAAEVGFITSKAYTAYKSSHQDRVTLKQRTPARRGQRI